MYLAEPYQPTLPENTSAHQEQLPRKNLHQQNNPANSGKAKLSERSTIQQYYLRQPTNYLPYHTAAQPGCAKPCHSLATPHMTK